MQKIFPVQRFNKTNNKGFISNIRWANREIRTTQICRNKNVLINKTKYITVNILLTTNIAVMHNSIYLIHFIPTSRLFRVIFETLFTPRCSLYDYPYWTENFHLLSIDKRRAVRARLAVGSRR